MKKRNQHWENVFLMHKLAHNWSSLRREWKIDICYTFVLQWTKILILGVLKWSLKMLWDLVIESRWLCKAFCCLKWIEIHRSENEKLVLRERFANQEAGSQLVLTMKRVKNWHIWSQMMILIIAMLKWSSKIAVSP